MALNLVIAAIMYWNTLYMEKAADHLPRDRRLPDPSLLRHVLPLGWHHIALTGDYDWNSGAAELATYAAIEACSAEPVSKVALEFLILTAARPGEFRGAQWTEADMENAPERRPRCFSNLLASRGHGGF